MSEATSGGSGPAYRCAHAGYGRLRPTSALELSARDARPTVTDLPDSMVSTRMQFFFYEIVARIVGAYLAYDCGVQLYNGIVERKITYRLGRSSDWVDLLLDWSTRQSWVVER